MNVLKGVFLVIWSLIGLALMVMLFGMLMFVMSGGPQKIVGSLNPARLFGAGLTGAAQLQSPNDVNGQGGQAGDTSKQPGTGAQSGAMQPGSGGGAGTGGGQGGQIR